MGALAVQEGGVDAPPPQKTVPTIQSSGLGRRLVATSTARWARLDAAAAKPAKFFHDAVFRLHFRAVEGKGKG